MGSEQAIVAADAPDSFRHLLTVCDFLTLDEAGAFDGMGHVELIDGEIFKVAPLYYPHGSVVVNLTIAVGTALDIVSGYEAAGPVSAELDDNNLPEADIIIVRTGVGDRFVTRDFAQVMIEISASSLRHDLGRKLRLYARAGVPEYWVADVNARQIIRMHAPAGEDYTERATFAFGEPVPSATIPGLIVDTSRLA